MRWHWPHFDGTDIASETVAEYDGDLEIDDALVEALIRAAKEIEKRVRALGPLD